MWRERYRRRGNRPGRGQFNRIAGRKYSLRRARSANAIYAIAAVLLVVGTDGVKDNVSGLCAPERVWLDDSDAARPLLVRIVKLDAQPVGGREANDLDGRRCGHAGNGQCAGGRADDDVACCKRVGRGCRPRAAFLNPGE
jgi:hypothetical protein